MQGLQRERGVPHPGVPVVPIAFASRGFRKGGRQSCDGGAGRHVGEALDRQGGTLDRLTPPVVGKTRVTEPPTPELRRRIELPGSLFHGLRCHEIRRPRQGAVQRLALLQHMAGTNAPPFDAECHVGLQAQGLTRAARVCGVPAAAHENPLRRCAPVVEHRLAHQLHLHAAVEAGDRANQHVVGVLVRGRTGVGSDGVLSLARSHRQRTPHVHPACRRVPHHRNGVAARLVLPGRRNVEAERPDPEHACLAVEEGTEHTGRVETGHAQPIDGTVGSDQRAGVTVREERVVRDRRKRRRCRRALGCGVVFRGSRHVRGPLPECWLPPCCGSRRARSSPCSGDRCRIDAESPLSHRAGRDRAGAHDPALR